MGFCGITLLHHEGLDKSQNGLHICVLSPVSSDVGISLCAVYPQKPPVDTCCLYIASIIKPLFHRLKTEASDTCTGKVTVLEFPLVRV